MPYLSVIYLPNVNVFDIFQSLKKEIHRRIDSIPKIVYEPRMINENDSQFIMPPDNHLPIFYCRLKAMDDVKLLGKIN